MVQISVINNVRNTNLNFKSKSAKYITETNNPPVKSVETETDLNKMPNNYISFKAYNADLAEKLSYIQTNASPQALKLIEKIKAFATNLKLEEITQDVILLIGLQNINDYIESLNSEKIYYDDETSFLSPKLLESDVDSDIFKDVEKRKKIESIIKTEIENLNKRLVEKSKDGFRRTNPEFSKNCIDEIFSLNQMYNVNGINPLYDSTIFASAYYSEDDDIRKEITTPLRMKMKDSIKIDNRPLEEKIHLSFYDEKAKNIWKNLAVGTNMVVLSDNNCSSEYLINSMHYLYEKNGKLDKINKDNTKFIIMNDSDKIDSDYFNKKFREFRKNPDTNYVIAMNIMDKSNSSLLINEDNLNTFTESAPNIRFVMFADKDVYSSATEDGGLGQLFDNFGETTVPIMNVENAKKMFAEQPELIDGHNNFSKNAIDKCIEFSAQLSGNYPEKAQRLISKVSSYYANKPKIQLPDVEAYLKEVKDTIKLSENQQGLLRIYDSDVKISDLVGKPTTSNEAKIIARNIKNKTIGTKGFLIYSQDGSIGAGRKYTAKAIAGSSKSPYIEIDATELLNPDFSQDEEYTISPEKMVKNIFDSIKAQAETNSSKSAVLFIENFDEFSDATSYMSFLSSSEASQQDNNRIIKQFVKEMNRAQDGGYNIVIFGSLDNEDFMNQILSDSLKFIDNIVLESPSRNAQTRAEIIDYFLAKKGIKLAGNNNVQADTKILINRLTSSLSYLEILTLLDKAKYVAIERKHNSVEKTDFTEAYLRLTTGKVTKNDIRDYKKKIVTSHECGHAINAIVMENYANEHCKNASLEGHKVNFITLDPRGDYGGAVYSTTDNSEYSFEHVFSELVLDYGGTSCEKEFYNQDGSWGITMDIAQATNYATIAASLMGQGKNFGKKSLNGMHFISEEDKNKINKDIDVMLKNAQVISDTIVKEYRGFIEEFTEKYSKLVGTGECIIHREEFIKMLNEWKSRQSKEKLNQLDDLYNDISKVIEATKNGVICKREDA